MKLLSAKTLLLLGNPRAESELIIPVLLQWCTGIHLSIASQKWYNHLFVLLSGQVVLGVASDSNHALSRAVKTKPSVFFFFYSAPLHHGDWWLSAFDVSGGWSWKSSARFLHSYQSAMLAVDWSLSVKRQSHWRICQLTLVCIPFSLFDSPSLMACGVITFNM